ncbi:MAG: hypothetical protein GY715_15200 [Planctomycetes bacterium]|nr:hypothetical protein [Planctomycetota bacterium]
MASFLSKLREYLERPESTPVEVRETLEEARRLSARIELDPITPTTDEPLTLRATVEAVQEDAFVVTKPVAGGLVRPLARFEPHELRFVGSRGLVTGRTHALGRYKMPNGADGFLYGYRLAMPETLRLVEPRQPLRTIFGRDCVREAELHVLSHRGPIHGLLEDISAGGAKLLCRNASSHLAGGATALFKVDLPEPIGSLQQMVRIVGVEPVPDRGAVRVRITFESKNEAIVEALRKGRGHLLTRRRSA